MGIGHRVACRFMIGPGLCRDEAFVGSSATFLESIFLNALIIVKLPLGPFREALAKPLSYFHARKLRHSVRLLLPYLVERIAEHGENKLAEYTDAISWTLEFPDADPKHNRADYLARELLHGLWAASSAPGGMMTEMLYQLLMEPKYLDHLRDEADAALSENGGWNEKTLDGLPLLDSFIREVNRMYPTGAGETRTIPLFSKPLR